MRRTRPPRLSAVAPLPARSLYRQFVDDLDTWVKILAGVVVIVGAVAAWFLRPGESAVESYREKLQSEICLGDLGAAFRVDPISYVESDGRIDKAAWLSVMDTVRSHIVDARKGLQDLKPPDELRAEWQASVAALDVYRAHWDRFLSYTNGVPQSRLTFPEYPGGTWTAHNSSASSALFVPLGKLMGKPCGAPTASTTRSG